MLPPAIIPLLAMGSVQAEKASRGGIWKTKGPLNGGGRFSLAEGLEG